MKILILLGVITAIFVGSANAQQPSWATSGPASGTGYPFSSIPVVASGTGTTAAVTATLPSLVAHTTYICGFSITPGSATAAITLTETVTGLANTLSYSIGAPVTAAGVTGSALLQTFSPCLPASAPNTAIVVTSGALGAGGVNNNVSAWGYQF